MTLTETNTDTDTDNESDQDWAMRNAGRQRHDLGRVGLLHGRHLDTSATCQRLRPRKLQRHVRPAQRHGDRDRLGLVVEPDEPDLRRHLGHRRRHRLGQPELHGDPSDTDAETTNEAGTETIADELHDGPSQTASYTSARRPRMTTPPTRRAPRPLARVAPSPVARPRSVGATPTR